MNKLMKSPKNLILYKDFENGKLFYNMTWIMENYENEYYNKYSFTDEQIDALFSGDQGRVNRAFCGPLAFINEADGELYSIYWLAEHSAEDYTAAGLPLEQVWKVAALAQTEEFSSCTVLGSKVADVLYRAAGGADVEDICPVHKFLYHVVFVNVGRIVACHEIRLMDQVCGFDR